MILRCLGQQTVKMGWCEFHLGKNSYSQYFTLNSLVYNRQQILSLKSFNFHALSCLCLIFSRFCFIKTEKYIVLIYLVWYELHFAFSHVMLGRKSCIVRAVTQEKQQKSDLSWKVPVQIVLLRFSPEQFSFYRAIPVFLALLVESKNMKKLLQNPSNGKIRRPTGKLSTLYVCLC